jgi:pimeloyl-ACP methyl ester carboxylesterase
VRVHQPVTGLRRVDANGLSFALREWGTGPLVLLCHGFPDTADTWDMIGPAIARAGYHVVAPFMRGYAPTALPGRDTDTRTLGEDVIALISALGSDRARIIGHDWGADAVYAAVHLGPDRIERMVAIGIPHRVALRVTPKLFWGVRHFVTLPLPGAARRFARDDFHMVDVLCRRWSPTWQFTAQDLEPVKNAFAAPGCLDAALGYYRANAFRVPDFMRPKISVRTLVIAGLDDPNCPVQLYHDAGRHYLGEYRVAEVRGGHFCHRESPQAVLDAVIPFLA